MNTDYDAADPYQGTSVRLIDWIIRSTGDLTEAQESLLYENFFLGLVQQAGYSVENARAFFTYYDVNGDGLYEMFTNITGQPQKIYTIREGQVTDISPDYTPEADETVSLGVEADGTIYMVTAKNPQWDQYHNYYTAADYTVYDLSFTDTDVSMEEAASFRGSYTNIGRRSFSTGSMILQASALTSAGWSTVSTLCLSTNTPLTAASLKKTAWSPVLSARHPGMATPSAEE